MILGISKNNYAELCSFLEIIELELTRGQMSRDAQSIS